MKGCQEKVINFRNEAVHFIKKSFELNLKFAIIVNMIGSIIYE